MSDEPQQTIKVVDKRRSASTGQTDSTDQSTSSDAASTKAESSFTAAGSSSVGTLGGDSSNPTLEQHSQEQQSEARPNQVDFPSFVLSFYTQALIMLGEIPNPETGLLTANREAARQTIDILEMIEVKTKGNLSPDESRLISEVVTSLQMAYVNKLK